MSEVLVLDAAQQDLPTHPLILSNICHLNVSNLARGGTRFPLLLLTTSTVDGNVTAPPACVVLDKKKKIQWQVSALPSASSHLWALLSANTSIP